MRLYRLLLRVYPAWFRERFAAEMLAAFEEDRRIARIEGGSAGRFWFTTLVDVIVSARTVRRQRPPAPSAAPRCFMEALRLDLAHAFTQLVRRPGFTIAAVLSLALGIGGNAALFAFADGFVFHPFAYPEPDRLVTIGSTFPRVSEEERFIEAISVPESLDIRGARTLTSWAAFDLGNRDISGGDRPERVFTALAFSDLFEPFGLRPHLGRGFTAAELTPGGGDVAVISHRVWQGRFSGDPSIVGRAIRVNGVPTTVVGVMPPELLLLGTDLWIPWGADPLTMPRHFRPLTLLARLLPGATLADANAELATIAGRTATTHGAAFKEYEGWRLAAVPWTTALMRDIRSAMVLVLGAMALVLLIACANLSSLALARSATRQRDMAICLALGAGRWGLARQQLAEVAWLALAGGALGLVVAYAGLPALVSLVPPSANTLGLEPTVGWRVVAWAAALTVGSAVVVALLPVYQATRTTSNDALKAEGRGLTANRGALRLRHGLIVGEIALAVVLLAGAGLFVRSFVNVQRVPLGFDADRVLTMRLTLPAQRYRGAAINDFFQRMLDTLAGMPGVREAAVATQLPLQSRITTPFRIEGVEAPADTLPTALLTVIGGQYLATLRAPLAQGRAIDDRDRANAPRVVVVNEAFVARYLPGGDPLGRQVVIGPAERPAPPVEIVGVVANVQNSDRQSAATPEVFVPLHQQTVFNQLFLLVRTDGDAAALLPAIRSLIAAQDADQPVYAVQTMTDVVASSQFRGRFSMALLVAFAVVALALAAVGIYGVMSQAVAARTHEIGLRLAVGADRRDVVGLVLRQVVRLTLAGLTLGLIASAALGATLRSALFQVGAFDPATMAVVVTVLAVVALIAGWLPAWRASRVDPMLALRYE